MTHNNSKSTHHCLLPNPPSHPRSFIWWFEFKFLPYIVIIDPDYAPHKIIRILEYGTFLLVQSGIKEKFNCQIRNPGLWNLEFCKWWNPESKFHWQGKNLESTGWNQIPKLSLITLHARVTDCLVWTLSLKSDQHQISPCNINVL